MTCMIHRPECYHLHHRIGGSSISSSCWPISSKKLSYNCLCTLELCTASMIVTSAEIFCPCMQYLSVPFLNSSLFRCLLLHFGAHSKLFFNWVNMLGNWRVEIFYNSFFHLRSLFSHWGHNQRAIPQWRWWVHIHAGIKKILFKKYIWFYNVYIRIVKSFIPTII